MRKVLVAGLGVLLLTTAFASEAFAQRRGFGGGGFHFGGGGGFRGINVGGGGWRGGGAWGGGWRGAGWRAAGWRGGNIGWGGGWRGAGWRTAGWGGWGGGWGYRRPYRPFLWGAAAALGTAAALSAFSYPYYGYDSYYYNDPYSYGYASYGPYNGPYYSYASYGYGACPSVPRLAWNGWRYVRVWRSAC